MTISESAYVIFNPLKRACLTLVIIALFISGCGEKAKTVDPVHVTPKQVKSTWRFETIYQPKLFLRPGPGQHWLAIDSKGYPHLAYGGDQLYYAWFDGSTWHNEIPDTHLGAGKLASLVLDRQDFPHIIYGVGGGFGYLTLIHTYQDTSGWHSETVDPDFCDSQDLDIQLDPQNRLSVVYANDSQSCSGGGVYTTRIRFAWQVDGEWKIETVAEPGMHPSLAYDAMGRPHISYLGGGERGPIYEAVLENNQWIKTVAQNDVSFSNQVIRLTIESGKWAHIIYISGDKSRTLEHVWQDSFGWHSEAISSSDSEIIPPQVSTFMDTNGQLHVFSAFNRDRKPELLQRDINGWKNIPISIDENQLYSPNLVMDQKGQLRLAYIQNYSIVYAEQQVGGWKTTIVDSGDDLGWHDTAALVFDQNGELHASSYSDVGIRYFSKKDGIWRDELVRKGVHSQTTSDPIYLLFDLQNQPHIFYWNYDDPPLLIHAFKNQTGWTNEAVPQSEKTYIEDWSRPVISPEGWPVFLRGIFSSPVFVVYRTPDGWKEKALDIRVSSSPFLALAYSSFQAASVDGSLTMPYILFSEPQAYPSYPINYVLKFRDPQQNKDRLLLELGPSSRYEVLYLGFETPEMPVLLATTRDNQLEHGIGVIVAAFEKEAWKPYYIDMHSAIVPVQPLDANGKIHLIQQIYCKKIPCTDELFYLVGTGSDWKKTGVNVAGLPSADFLVKAVALRPTGQFCIMLYDLHANDFNLGCLENLE